MKMKQLLTEELTKYYIIYVLSFFRRMLAISLESEVSEPEPSNSIRPDAGLALAAKLPVYFVFSRERNLNFVSAILYSMIA